MTTQACGFNASLGAGPMAHYKTTNPSWAGGLNTSLKVDCAGLSVATIDLTMGINNDGPLSNYVPYVSLSAKLISLSLNKVNFDFLVLNYRRNPRFLDNELNLNFDAFASGFRTPHFYTTLMTPGMHFIQRAYSNEIFFGVPLIHINNGVLNQHERDWGSVRYGLDTYFSATYGALKSPQKKDGLNSWLIQAIGNIYLQLVINKKDEPQWFFRFDTTATLLDDPQGRSTDLVVMTLVSSGFKFNQ